LDVGKGGGLAGEVYDSIGEQPQTVGCRIDGPSLLGLNLREFFMWEKKNRYSNLDLQTWKGAVGGRI